MSFFLQSWLEPIEASMVRPLLGSKPTNIPVRWVHAERRQSEDKTIRTQIMVLQLFAVTLKMSTYGLKDKIFASSLLKVGVNDECRAGIP